MTLPSRPGDHSQPLTLLRSPWQFPSSVGPELDPIKDVGFSFPIPYCQVTRAGSRSNLVGRAGMLKGQMIKGRVPRLPAHIHQFCLAFDAPNLLIFVRGSRKHHSSRLSHLSPSDSLLTCTWYIYHVLRSWRTPRPHPLKLPCLFSSWPCHALTAEWPAECVGQPGCVWAPRRPQLQASAGWGELPSTARRTSPAQLGA